MTLYVPYTINFLILKNILNKKLTLTLFNTDNYITILIPQIKYYRESNFITIDNYKNVTLTLLNFLYSLNNFFLKKINFKGKGYKITKKKNFLLLNFNHSHLTWLLLFNIICIKCSKNKYLITLKNINKLTSMVTLISKLRPVNIYTKRGIKLSKQRVFRKIGKRT